MTATVQTINKFCEETGISRTKVKELINDFVVPLVPRDEQGGLVLIDKQEFDRRLGAGQVTLPIPPRKRKELEAIAADERINRK